MRNPLSTIFKPIKPVSPPSIQSTPSPMRLWGSAPQEEKPWPIWAFVAYMIGLAVLWLVAKPVIDELVTQLIEPLEIAGYLDLFYKLLVWIFFLGMAWVAFSKTFRNRG